MTARGTTTVVIPVFNGARFVAEAIASVRDQTRPVEEIIVVDDGSTDDTAAVVAELGVTYLRQENQGPSAARNLAIARASGEYIAPLDADDLWPTGRMAALAGRLDADPAVAVVLGTQRLLVEPGATLPSWVPESGDPASLGPADLPRPTNAFVARRSAFEQLGGYAVDLVHGEDADWILRVRDAGLGVDFVDDLALVRRLHGQNLTNDAAHQRRAVFEVLQRRIDRRRVAAEES